MAANLSSLYSANWWHRARAPRGRSPSWVNLKKAFLWYPIPGVWVGDVTALEVRLGMDILGQFGLFGHTNTVLSYIRPWRGRRISPSIHLIFHRQKIFLLAISCPALSHRRRRRYIVTACPYLLHVHGQYLRPVHVHLTSCTAHLRRAASALPS